MLNVFVTQPRPGREELMALGAFAALTAELVRTGVELVSKNLEVAQQRQALSSRVWIEQAKGMVAAAQGVTLDEAFQQLRGRARASSRKLAEVAQEVVQDVQRERLAAKALDDARVRAAEARAQAAEQALQAGPNRAGPTYRGPGPSLNDADAWERAADQRDRLADARDRAADQRQRAAGRDD